MENLPYGSAIELAKRPLVLWSLSAFFIMVDYICGPFIQFPVTFLLPIIAAAWFHGRRQAFTLACILPLIRLSFNVFFWTAPWTILESVVNASIRIIVFLTIAYFVHRVKLQNDALSSEVQTLTGILPICSFCKKIRTEQQEWVPVEQYVRERSDARFSHGFCPECGQQHYGDLLNKKS